MLKIEQYFPNGYTPNVQQIKLLKAIDSAFNAGKKFVICNAPTGTGKSFISKTIANSSENIIPTYEELISSYRIYKMDLDSDNSLDDIASHGTFVLTITKALQDQYKSFFNDSLILKGKSNYQCNIDSRYSVDVAPCIHIEGLKKKCWAQNICPFYNARNEALIQKFSILNYSMFLSLPDAVKKRQFLICDEASELEEELVKYFTCSINFKLMKKLDIQLKPTPKSYGAWLNWLFDIAGQLVDKEEELKNKLHKLRKKQNISNQTEAVAYYFILVQQILKNFRMLTKSYSTHEYIIEPSEKEVTFTPLHVDHLANPYLFDYADKVILMSATIIDPPNFCKTLGIENYEYVEADSTFDPKYAPIYVNTKTKLNYQNLKFQLPNILKQVQQIINLHKNEKGIIHTHTQYIADYLRNKLKEPRCIYREPGINNEQLMRQHFESKEPTILVSPSMKHGVDLKDDLARFQIIIKAPFLPITNKRIKKLLHQDQNWYTNKMLISLIQASGRGIRSQDDYCNTYILDGTAVDAILQNKQKLPKYFIKRFI